MTVRVLIVDDSETCRRQTRACLVALGVPDAACREAEHGDQALAMLRQQGADLLITDLDMPVMGGFELLYTIERNQRFQGLARIVITATTSTSLPVMLRQLAVAAVLRKPASVDELGPVLARLGLASGAPAPATDGAEGEADAGSDPSGSAPVGTRERPGREQP